MGNGRIGLDGPSVPRLAAWEARSAPAPALARSTAERTAAQRVAPPRSKPASWGQSAEEWQTWKTWSACSKTCGQGTRTRFRRHNGGRQVTTETGTCNLGTCPLNPTGLWLGWGPWDECSVTCGHGTTNRTRPCDGDPEDAQGDADCPMDQGFESKDCQKEICPGYRIRIGYDSINRCHENSWPQ